MKVSEEITEVLQSSMTVGDLIHYLQRYDRATPVVCSSDYGDRTHTEQCLPISEYEITKLNFTRFKKSSYSSSGVKIDRNDSDYDEECKDSESVLVMNLG